MSFEPGQSTKGVRRGRFSRSGSTPGAATAFIALGRSARAFLRGLRLTDDRSEQFGQPSAGGTIATGELGHFSKAQLGVRKGQAALGFVGRRHEMVKLRFMPDLHSAAREQLELTVERTQSDAQLRQDRRSGARSARKVANQTVKPSRPLKRDVHRRTAPRIRVAGHDEAIPRYPRWNASRRPPALLLGP